MSVGTMPVTESVQDEPAGAVELPEKTYDRVLYFAEEILREEGKTSDENAMRGALVIEKAKKKFPEAKAIQESTFSQYLSESARDPKSKINTRGRWKGYYLAEVVDEIPSQEMSPEEEADTEQGPSRTQKEKLLYKVLEDWLIEQGYQARDISNVRSLGPWGNPDIVGILPTDMLQGVDIELVTIEAKASYENWQKVFFEAVSHRRFANRVYFAFAHPDEAIGKIPQQMRYYSELYGVGILVIRLESQKFKELCSGSLSEPLSSDDVDVTELYSAPYFYVQPKYQMQLRQAIDLKSFTDFISWGRVPSGN